MLFEYMQTTQRLIHDSRQRMIDPQDIVTYVNRARREVARRAQCIRYLTPVSGALTAISVTAAGSGYSASPVVTIATPDSPSGAATTPNGVQATATATVSSGSISAVTIGTPGNGYFEPAVTITDTTGLGATAVVTGISTYVNQLLEGQEQYPFSNIVFQTTGIESVIQVKSVSIIYSNYRYSLPMYSFSIYQAMIRQYSSASQYQYVPAFASQYGRGAAGIFYLYPIPSQTYQAEFDCICEPTDLVLDSDVEIIPDPWTDAVPFFAAYLCFLEMQNFNSARGIKNEFDLFMRQYSSATQSGRISNPYGRW